MKYSNLLATVVVSLLPVSNALELQVGNKNSVCNAATEIIDGIMDYYLGTRYGGTVGMFQQPYYWWESGLVFGGLIDTWKICDNNTYVDIIKAAFEHQKGVDNNFHAENQSDVMANDDQLFWGLAAMEAAERDFPELSGGNDEPSYIDLALTVYNEMAGRWDESTCGGGLRWQILSNMSGWDYKSTVSTAGLFALSGRFARYTGDDDFKKTASRVLRWMKKSSFVYQMDGNDYYNVNDGAEINDNNRCPIVNGAIWSYNYALMIMGTSYMYSATQDKTWSDELGKFIGGLEHFMLNTTGGDTLFEYQCDVWKKCNNDQRAFRAIVARSLGEVVQLVPDQAERAQKIIDASAKGAAESCSGGSDGKTCGMNWGIDGWDGVYGLGEQIAALEIIQNSVINSIPQPCTEETCGEDIDDDKINTVPAPTITVQVTDVQTNVITETLVISNIAQVFYTGTTTTSSSN